MPNPAGRALATDDVSQPLIWLRLSGLDPNQLCQRTGHFEPVYGMPDAPTDGPGNVRHWGWHRILRAHVSAVY